MPNSTTRVTVGSPAPDFELKDQDGRVIRLSQVLKDGPLLLAFYPGDFTPVCTRQLCSYRSQYDEFNALGVQLIGISADSEAKHADFKREHAFQFPLLSDPGKKVARLYGVVALGGLIPARANFVIGRNGVVLYHHQEKLAITHQGANAVIEILHKLQSAGKL